MTFLRVNWGRITRTTRWLAVTALLAACGGPKPVIGAAPRNNQRDLLTRLEIEQSTVGMLDLFQAIRTLRPHFLEGPRGLQSRGSLASRPTAVYINRVRQAGLESMRSLSALAVEEVRYLDPTASQSEFGPVASGGAVVITLRKPSNEPDLPPLEL